MVSEDQKGGERTERQKEGEEVQDSKEGEKVVVDGLVSDKAAGQKGNEEDEVQVKEGKTKQEEIKAGSSEDHEVHTELENPNIPDRAEGQKLQPERSGDQEGIDIDEKDPCETDTEKDKYVKDSSKRPEDLKGADKNVKDLINTDEKTKIMKSAEAVKKSKRKYGFFKYSFSSKDNKNADEVPEKKKSDDKKVKRKGFKILKN